MRIGNSRGVRIPKAMIEEAELTDDVELRVVDGEIRISSVEPQTGGLLLTMSSGALADWERAEEDAAWRHL